MLRSTRELSERRKAIPTGAGGRDGARWIQTGGGPPMAGAKCFKVVSEAYDWVVCNKWDGETAGTEEIKVAKPYLLRRAPWANSEERDGYTYTQSAAGSRISTRVSDSDVVTEYITPGYVAGDLIWAVRENTLVVDEGDEDKPVTWADVNRDSRTWSE